jgi:hypothetical protein
MSTINKSQFWQDHITAWQGSGLSQTAYSSRVMMNLPLGVRLELSASDLPVVLPAVLHILRESS